MSVKRCGNCGHPYYRHAPDDLELCRIKGGCHCPGFLTVRKGDETFIDKAVRIVRFAHHDHAFSDEHCTPANCSVAEWLAANSASP